MSRSVFSPMSYVIVCIFFAILFTVVLLIWQLRVLGCNVNGYDKSTYMASCSLPTFGDYEHGAIAFHLETRAVRAIEDADVLYLGFSHGMVALSTTATERYFGTLGKRFYNLGFSGEYSPFYDLILPELNLRSKVAVIEAQPFFRHVLTKPTAYILHHPLKARIEYLIKTLWLSLYPEACLSFSKIVNSLCGGTFAVFRSRENGRLLMDYRLLFGDPLPEIPTIRKSSFNKQIADETIDEGKLFISRHGLDVSCVIIIAAPDSFPEEYYGEKFAETIAAGIGAMYVDVEVDNLVTVDRAHLTPLSAEAWSEKFWLAADPIIKRCVSSSR